MQSEEKIRTFIAINISFELREAFRSFLEELIRIGGDVKWVRPESIHLTLKFLGNLDASKIQPVCEAVQKTCEGFSTFRLRSGQKGAFPNLKRPRVFWVGLTETNGEILADLQAKLELVLAEVGFESEARRFHPHITVGRVRSAKKIDEVAHKFMEYRFPELEFMADQVLIMKSELTPRGALYSIQKAVPLIQ
jgi:RNA 2',3'-cyclic 3'-phosphodiesterase